jgi:hypothetical protein
MTARSFVCCLIPMSNVTEFDADLRNTFMIGVATAGRGADTAQAGGGARRRQGQCAAVSDGRRLKGLPTSPRLRGEVGSHPGGEGDSLAHSFEVGRPPHHSRCFASAFFCY